jgi:cell division protein FtsW (lipid II flippase)
MPINVVLVKRLLATCVVALAVLSVILIMSSAGLNEFVPLMLIIAISVVFFLALLWLWVLWLLHFRRSGQKREFWLCYCLPYAYAIYRSMALLRFPTADDA